MTVEGVDAVTVNRAWGQGILASAAATAYLPVIVFVQAASDVAAVADGVEIQRQILQQGNGYDE